MSDIQGTNASLRISVTGEIHYKTAYFEHVYVNQIEHDYLIACSRVANYHASKVWIKFWLYKNYTATDFSASLCDFY